MSMNTLSELQTGLVRTIQGGRIELGDTSDHIRWTPYCHNIIGLYDGGSWVPVTISGNIYHYISQNDYNGVGISSDTNYDVYAKFLSSTSISLELAPWSSDSTRDTNTWKLFNGVRVYDLTDEGKTMRYIGMVRPKIIDEQIQFSDDLYRRLVVNLNNVIIKTLRTYNTSGSQESSNTSGSWIEFHNGGQIRAEFLVIDKNLSTGGISQAGQTGGSELVNFEIAWALNTTGGSTGPRMRYYVDAVYNDNGNKSHTMGFGAGNPQVGYNYVTQTFRSWTDSDADVDGGGIGSGMVLMVQC